MVCAMVLWFDNPFEKADAVMGLIKGAEVRMASGAAREEIRVLITRGFERIPAPALDHLRALNYRLEDASALQAEVLARYPFAANPRIWRGESFHEMNFQRWLVLEAAFGDEPVLTMDVDIIWRADPGELIGQWMTGGSFLCLFSTCMAFVKGRSWYEAYREGLARLSADPAYGAEYRKDGSGLQHDQALCQYLVSTGQLENDKRNMAGGGLEERYFMSANPLGIEPRPGEGPLSFEQSGGVERIGGRIAPFWHMQTWFIRYLFMARFLPAFLGDDGVRIPFDRSGKDLGVRVLSQLHEQIRRRQVRFGDDPDYWMRLTNRSGVYDEFFDGSLAQDAFCERRWWKPGVWAQ